MATPDVRLVLAAPSTADLSSATHATLRYVTLPLDADGNVVASLASDSTGVVAGAVTARPVAGVITWPDCRPTANMAEGTRSLIEVYDGKTKLGELWHTIPDVAGPVDAHQYEADPATGIGVRSADTITVDVDGSDAATLGDYLDEVAVALDGITAPALLSDIPDGTATRLLGLTSGDVEVLHSVAAIATAAETAGDARYLRLSPASAPTVTLPNASGLRVRHGTASFGALHLSPAAAGDTAFNVLGDADDANPLVLVGRVTSVGIGTGVYLGGGGASAVDTGLYRAGAGTSSILGPTAGLGTLNVAAATSGTHAVNRDTGDGRYLRLSPGVAATVDLGSAALTVRSTSATGQVIVDDGTAGHGKVSIGLIGDDDQSVSVYTATGDTFPVALLGQVGSLGITNGLSLGPGGSSAFDATVRRTGTAELTVAASTIKVGTASETIKVGGSGATFGVFGVAGTTRTAAYTQTYSTTSRTVANITAQTVTDNSGGTASTAVAALGATDYATDGPVIRNAIATIIRELNRERVDSVGNKNNINMIIDDQQGYGWFQ